MPSPTDKILGNSATVIKLRETVARFGPTESKILILGENGVGKELVADAIHTSSSRAGKAFVALNCAAVPESLLEAEIFGFEKGSFTGATARREGVFERADGGTLFLDEIGDMPLMLQSKLLRVLQSGTFERIGGHQTLKVDVRVVAATNKDLKKAVEEKTFREDLYHRIAVIPIHVPPLRARGDDIVELAMAFGIDLGRKFIVSAQAIDELKRYQWPGNVRELRNVVERLIMLVPDGEPVWADDIKAALTLDTSTPHPSTSDQAKARAAFVVVSEAPGELEKQPGEPLVVPLVSSPTPSLIELAGSFTTPTEAVLVETPEPQFVMDSIRAEDKTPWEAATKRRSPLLSKEERSQRLRDGWEKRRKRQQPTQEPEIVFPMQDLSLPARALDLEIGRSVNHQDGRCGKVDAGYDDGLVLVTLPDGESDIWLFTETTGYVEA